VAKGPPVCACGLPFVSDILILAKDLEYGDVFELSQLIEEVSKLLEAYSQAILNSDS